MILKRREALRLIGAGTFVLGVSGISPTLVLAATPDLSVITGDDPKANVRAAVNALGGMKRFVSKGDKVVLKPNMGFGNVPLRTSTTEPKVVRALAEMALEAGAKQVLVFDNPCHKANIVLEVCGVKNELAGLQDTFTYIIQADKFFKEVQIPKGVVLKKTDLAVDILEADTIINIPVAKSHGGAKVSFGMKNWMGVVQNRKPWHVWMNLHQAIADISTFVKPKLTVLDATRCLVTGGPGGPGEVANTKTIVAGIDPVAVDAYGLNLAPFGGNGGYKVQDIPFILKAEALGVGISNLDKLNIYKKKI